MKKLILFTVCMFILVISCKKKDGQPKEEEVITDGIKLKQVIETNNGITYKVFTKVDATSFKGILVMGSGNNEDNPTAGILDGAAETALCQKAAANGYLAAIVQYRKTPGTADWNTSAKMIGEDYNKCIAAIANKYSVDKNKSVVGGFSYASFMLLTDIAYNESLEYCKGLLAACGSTDADKASKFKIPIYSLTCQDENEAYPGNYVGKNLYNQIPAQSAIKVKSEGFTDQDCTGHCQGNWTDKMYIKMVGWLQ